MDPQELQQIIASMQQADPMQGQQAMESMIGQGQPAGPEGQKKPQNPAEKAIKELMAVTTPEYGQDVREMSKALITKLVQYL